MFLFFAKNLALGENFLSPTLNIIQPFFCRNENTQLDWGFRFLLNLKIKASINIKNARQKDS